MYNYLNLQVNKIPLEQEVKEQIYEVEFTGELNYQNCHEITSILSTLQEKNIKKIIFNFNDLTRIDSAGIGLIIHHTQKFGKNDFEFVIVHANSQVLSTFNNVNMNKFVQLIDTKDEGVDYFLNKAE